MKILHDLVQLADKSPQPLKHVSIGVHWTLVESKVPGLASTQIAPPPHYRDTIENVGKLENYTVAQLAALVHSENLLEGTLGLAAINSTIEIDSALCSQENAFETIVKFGQNKNIGIIGHFPFVSRLKDIAENLWVLELVPRPGDMPAENASELLPKCDVVGITATTLINHSFETVMGYCKKDALKIMIGPSTPMTPILFDYGIDVLAGSKVLNSNTVLKQIQQGANFRQLSDIELLTYFRPNFGVKF